MNSDDCGSTATIGFIRFEDSKRVLYIANVGDSAAIVFADSGISKLTVDDRLTNNSERERIR